MNYSITLEQAKNMLEKFDLAYETISLDDGYTILCTKRGGRILGPFAGEQSESIFWMNEAFKDEKQFERFLQDGDWNMGGDRVWIAPEIPFFIPDRADFFGSYTVPKELDPGNYSIEKRENTVFLQQSVALQTYHERCGEKRFDMRRKIGCAKNPLRTAKQFDKLMQGVQYCGFEQEIEIEARDTDTSIYLETWSLTQVNPKGVLLVPQSGMPEYLDYYEPIEPQMYRIEDGKMEIDVTGDVRYKLGFPASKVLGRAGYMGKLKNGQEYLFIRNYFNDPSNLYCCDPCDMPGKYGYSMFLYNDPGSQGGFAEFENTATTISGDTGKTACRDKINYYIFVGNKDRLNKIGYELLGVKRG